MSQRRQPSTRGAACRGGVRSRSEAAPIMRVGHERPMHAVIGSNEVLHREWIRESVLALRASEGLHGYLIAGPQQGLCAIPVLDDRTGRWSRFLNRDRIECPSRQQPRAVLARRRPLPYRSRLIPVHVFEIVWRWRGTPSLPPDSTYSTRNGSPWPQVRSRKKYRMPRSGSSSRRAGRGGRPRSQLAIRKLEWLAALAADLSTRPFEAAGRNGCATEKTACRRIVPRWKVLPKHDGLPACGNDRWSVLIRDSTTVTSSDSARDHLGQRNLTTRSGGRGRGRRRLDQLPRWTCLVCDLSSSTEPRRRAH